MASPRYMEKGLLTIVKIEGRDDLLHQDWENIYIASKREVIIPQVKEFYDCAYLSSEQEIVTRFNNRITLFTNQDLANALDFPLQKDERYKETWKSNCPDYNCIWKDTCPLINHRASNLIDAYRFNFEVIGQIMLPIEENKHQVNELMRYALYKNLKRIKINPVYLIWKHMTNFLRSGSGSLLFGSAICTMMEKKELLSSLTTYLLSLDDDIIWYVPISLENQSI